ncbi:hypothetical protein [Methylorubrum extorquens]|nr:hypothetical protein [Methylorubrum extorquens]
MGGSSADIEALLVDVTDPDNPTPGMLPAIFRDIVGRLDAAGLPYAVVGRIALTLHEQARFIGGIEIVADLEPDGHKDAAEFVRATQARFAAHMDPHQCRRPIDLNLRACTCATEAGLLAEAVTHPWFGVPARLASAEHLLWLWCSSDAPDHPVDAAALIAGGTVDLHRVQALLRETDDIEGKGRRRLRLTIGDAVLSTTFSFSRFMAERRAQLAPDRRPVWRLQPEANGDRDDP